MRPYVITFACLLTVLGFINAAPVPGSNQELDVLQIPLSNGKELDVLTLGTHDQEQLIAERNKRTIGLLRELFPDITKQIDGIVNRIIAQVIRVAGPDVLRSVLGGNRNTTPRPNLADDFDDDDDDNDAIDTNKLDNNNNDNDNNNNNNKSPTSSEDNTRIQIDLPTFPPESAQADATNKVSSTSLATGSISTSTTTPITKTSTTSSTTPSTTSSTTTTTTSTTTTTTTSPILIISPTTSLPTTTTTVPTTTESPILIISPTTTTTTTSPSPTTTTTPLTTINVPNSLTSSMVNSLTTSLQSELNSNSTSEASTVNESQLKAIIESLNRLLNSTNYFVATRDNSPASSLLSQPTATATTTSPTTADSTTTPKITKLLPNGATDTQIDLSAINKQLEETIRVARQVKEAEDAAQAVAALQQPAQLPIPSSPKVEETIQLSFNNELTNSDKPKSISNELQLSDSKSPAIDDLSLDSNEDTADLDDRNKRFLQFGGAAAAGGSSSTSSGGGTGGAGGTGGSGNFLFDIVRLFSGSVQTQAGDEAANSVSGSDSDSDSDSNRANDGYTEGIPGPVTRLVVLANRGLANLVQDLILRVAATSEKFVNFKAKLITALI